MSERDTLTGTVSARTLAEAQRIADEAAKAFFGEDADVVAILTNGRAEFEQTHVAQHFTHAEVDFEAVLIGRRDQP